MVLKNLGHDSHALGFMAGFTGQEIVRLLDEWGVQSDFIRVEQGISRINVKLRSNEESEINGQDLRSPRNISDKVVSTVGSFGGRRCLSARRKHTGCHAG